MGYSKEEIGERILELQKILKLNSKNFSEKVNIDTSQMGKIEKGKLGLSPESALKISETFKISPLWLLYGIGEYNNWNIVPRETLEKSTSEPLNKLIDGTRVLIDSNARLVAMLEQERSNNFMITKTEEVPPAQQAQWQRVLNVLAMIGSGKQWPTQKDAINELDRLLFVPQKRGVKKDKQNA